MNSTASRKEAIKAFKERKTVRGVFAVRCEPTGGVWVGAFTNLEAMRNRLWFSLRQQSHRDQALQDEWNTHGEQAFQYEILEKLDDDLPAIGVTDALKEKKEKWLTKLGARSL